MHPIINLVLNGEGAFADLQDHIESIILLSGPFTISRITHGMESGATSLMIRIDLPDGRTVLQETSLAAFLFAARGLEAAEHRN